MNGQNDVHENIIKFITVLPLNTMCFVSEVYCTLNVHVLHLSTCNMLSHTCTNVKAIHTLLWLQYKVHVQCTCTVITYM